MSKGTLKNEKGKLVLVKGKELKIIGNIIDPTEYQTNLDTKVVKVFLEFEHNGKKVVKKVNRGDITKSGIRKLTDYGADSWEDEAEHHVKFVRSRLDSIPKTYEHSTVGLGEYEEKRIIKLHRGVGIDSRYNGSGYNIKPKGEYKEWLKIIGEEVLGKRYLEFALVVGFVSIVINLLSEEENMASMIVNFCGSTSKGKTLATRLALSIWGLPDTLDNGLLRSWFGTDQGILSHLTDNFGIPIGLDDTSLQENEKDFTQIIYQIVNGQTKAALTKDRTVTKPKEWRTVVISSSEESIIKKTDPNKKGISVRIFELIIDQITESAENAQNIEKVIMKNYGHAGVKFAEELIDVDSKELVERLHEIKDEILEELEEDSLSQRIALKLAVILLTGELVKELMDINIDIDTLKQTLVEMEQKSIDQRNITEKAYLDIVEYFQTNMSKFFEDGENPNRTGEMLGKYYVNTRGEVKELAIPENNFGKIMEKLGYNKDEIIQAWNEKEILSHEANRNTRRKVFRPKTPKIPMYCIKLKQEGQNVISIRRTENVQDIEEVLGDIV